MVLHVPFLRLLIKGWELGVVQEVMGQIVHDVSRNTTAEDGSTHVPVPKNGVSELPEWSSQCNEESRRHHKTISVHWKVVVDTMEEKVGGYGEAVIWQIAKQD